MDKKRLRIAIIGQKGIPAIYGGIERHVEETAVRLSKKGHDVTVYCRGYYMRENQYEKTKNTVDLAGIHLKILPTIHSKHLDAITHCTLSTIHALFQQFDIIHYHALGPSVLSFLPRIVGTKTIVTIHGLDWMRAKWNKFASFCLKMAEKTSYYFPCETIAVSRTLKKYYDQKYNTNIVYIPNGNTCHAVKEPKVIKSKYGVTKGSYIIFVSRLVPEKGCHYLIEAFKKIKTAKKLFIVGGGSYSAGYIKGIKTLAAGDTRIKFTGYVYGEELEELLSNAYCFVLPSELEGLPIVILEALTYGRCVLASDIPENMEIIAPDNELKYGYLFKNKDVRDLQVKLEYLLTHENEVKEIGKKTLEYITENFDWDKITNQLEDVYYQLLEKKSGS